VRKIKAKQLRQHTAEAAAEAEAAKRQPSISQRRSAGDPVARPALQ